MGEDEGKKCSCIADEVLALKLVKVYFEKVARMGLKRKLDFDSIINAYFYALQRLKNKDKELKNMVKLVEDAERRMAAETRDELFPSMK